MNCIFSEPIVYVITLIYFLLPPMSDISVISFTKSFHNLELCLELHKAKLELVYLANEREGVTFVRCYLIYQTYGLV